MDTCVRVLVARILEMFGYGAWGYLENAECAAVQITVSHRGHNRRLQVRSSPNVSIQGGDHMVSVPAAEEIPCPRQTCS
jgi:hypothetical protein